MISNDKSRTRSIGLTSIDRIRQRVDQVAQPRHHLNRLHHIAHHPISPLEQVNKLLLHLRRCDVVWIEMIRLGLLLHDVGLRQLFVGVAAAADRELGEEVADERGVRLARVLETLGQVDDAGLRQMASIQSEMT